MKNHGKVGGSFFFFVFHACLYRKLMKQDDYFAKFPLWLELAKCLSVPYRFFVTSISYTDSIRGESVVLVA